MLDYINGKLTFKQGNVAVVDVAGIGFKINISLQCFDLLPEINQEVKIFTILKPKEDDIQLYGFLDKIEREVFETITSVSGIGPKTALLILSSVNVNELIKFINTENTSALQKMQGIGKKTADRIIFELKDKIKNIAIENQSQIIETDSTAFQKNETILALISLGYSRNSADKAVQQALMQLDGQTITIEKLIKQALRFAIK